jgi:hypothetical protein
VALNAFLGIAIWIERQVSETLCEELVREVLVSKKLKDQVEAQQDAIQAHHDNKVNPGLKAFGEHSQEDTFQLPLGL